jgi:hypothetical protein
MQKRSTANYPRPIIKSIISLLLEYVSFSACSFDVLSTRLLVLGAKEVGTAATQPGAELGELFLEAGGRLAIHVGLSDDLGHVDCGGVLVQAC